MYHYINDEIKVNFHVPDGVKEIMDMAEKADKEEDLMNYLEYADTIDVMAKNCCAAGVFTKKMWDTLCMRYCQW